MALPAPPPPPSSPAPAPLHVLEVDDLPYVAPIPTTVIRRGLFSDPRFLERAARVGLVLAIVVALAGVVGATTKSGDDGGTRVASGGTPTADEDPLDDPAEDDDNTAARVTDGDPLLVPAGFQVVQGDGVYLALPAEWESLSPRTLGRMLDDDALEEIFPDMDPDLRDNMQSVIASGALLVSIDPDPVTGGANVTIASIPVTVPFDDIAEDVGAELESMGLDVVMHGSREVETPLGTALRISYSGTVAGRSFDSVQYYVPVDDETIIITGTSAVEITDAAVQTLHLGEAPTPA